MKLTEERIQYLYGKHSRYQEEGMEVSGWREFARDVEAEVLRLNGNAGGEAVAKVRTWHKSGDQHAELLDWERGLFTLPDGDHILYTHSQPQSEAGWKDEGPACSGGWKNHAEQMEREMRYWRDRAQTMYEHQKGQCWYWQGDGHDHPESMANALPVVIRADELRAMLSAAPKVG